jgi:GAF domain-containing protein
MEHLSVTRQISRIAFSLIEREMDTKTMLSQFVQAVRDVIECEAAAVRLEKDGDFPYFVHQGFPESALEKESSAAPRDQCGKPIPCPSGCGHFLDCLCKAVVCGNTDNSKPYFTQYGTFFCNSTSALLASSTAEDSGCRTKDFCNACGYESVVLTPLIHRGSVIGLIQLNDCRSNRFPESVVLSLEMIADLIALSVGHKKMVGGIREAMPFQEDGATKSIKICSNCKSIKLGNNRWKSIESFIASISNICFSHTVCSNCREEVFNQTFSLSSYHRNFLE